LVRSTRKLLLGGNGGRDPRKWWIPPLKTEQTHSLNKKKMRGKEIILPTKENWGQKNKGWKNSPKPQRG